MLQIRSATAQDYPAVRDFYYLVTDEAQNTPFPPGWKRDIYPDQEFLRSSIRRGELFIGEADGSILAAMVVNRACNDGYRQVAWSVEAAEDELLVIHALGVRPAFFGRGLAKEMVRHVLEAAAASAVKTVRLDVLEGNLPAERAYTRLGFSCVDTLRMYYEDTGWTNFKVFEYLLPEKKPPYE